MILIKHLTQSKLDSDQLLALKVKSTSEKEACLAEARHWQMLYADTPVLVENVASGICVVTTQPDQAHQLWRLTSLAAIADFQRSLASQPPVGIYLIIGDTESTVSSLDQAYGLAGVSNHQPVRFYPFYADVQTVLEQHYPKTLARLSSHYLISRAAHLTFQLQQGQLILERVSAHRLMPAQVAADAELKEPIPTRRHRRNSFTPDWEAVLGQSSLSQPMRSTSPPLPSKKEIATSNRSLENINIFNVSSNTHA